MPTSRVFDNLDAFMCSTISVGMRLTCSRNRKRPTAILQHSLSGKRPAFHNAAKHEQAPGAIFATATRVPHTVLVTVTNPGLGAVDDFDPSPPSGLVRGVKK